MKIVAFVPIKLNNERIPGKNTKRFFDGTPLMYFIQKTLLACDGIDEVYIYCSKEEIKEYLLDGVHYLKRDERFDSQKADLNELIYSFANAVNADIYIMTHTTSPFLKIESIKKGIEAVQSGKYDSALAVKRIQEFIWKDGKAANYNPQKIPRTQDLEVLYAETSGFFIFTRDVITNRKSRIGSTPYMVEVDSIEAVDIDEPIDFEIASAIYDHIVRKRT